MNTLKIAQVLALAPMSPIDAVGGIVRMVGDYKPTVNEHGTISVQSLGIEDDTGVIDVKIGNHDAISPSLVDEQAPIWFVAHRKDNGTTTGLRVAEEEAMVEGEVQMIKFLMVARSATVMTDDEFQAFMGTQAPAQVSKPAPTVARAPVQAPAAQTQAPAPTIASAPAHEAPAPKQASFMRVSQLYYERQLDAAGKLAGEKMGITISIDPGGKSAEAVAAAKNFLSKHLPQASEVA